MRSKEIKPKEKSSAPRLLMAIALLTAALLLCASALGAQSGQPSASGKSQVRAAPAGSHSAASASWSPTAIAAAPNATSSKMQTPSAGTKPTKPAESGAGMVWINTASGVYHKNGSRWYGKTKNGQYMPEEDAVKAGYNPAK